MFLREHFYDKNVCTELQVICNCCDCNDFGAIWIIVPLLSPLRSWWLCVRLGTSEGFRLPAAICGMIRVDGEETAQFRSDVSLL